jgi:hypothetical protein
LIFAPMSREHLRIDWNAMLDWALVPEAVHRRTGPDRPYPDRHQPVDGLG